MQDEQQPDLVGLSAEIVSAYVAKNHIQPSETPGRNPRLPTTRQAFDTCSEVASSLSPSNPPPVAHSYDD